MNSAAHLKRQLDAWPGQSALWSPIVDKTTTLFDELDSLRAVAKTKQWQGGWIRSLLNDERRDESATAFPCVAHRQQVLPNVAIVHASSTTMIAQRLVALLVECAQQSPTLARTAWRLHATGAHQPTFASPVKAAFLTALGRDKLLRPWFALRRSPATSAWRTHDEALVQLAFVSNDCAAISVAVPDAVLSSQSSSSTTTLSLARRSYWRRCLSRMPGGLVVLDGNIRAVMRDAPSLAYLKLLHIEALMGESISCDETVVDLGSVS